MYSEEFKNEILKLIHEGKSVKEISISYDVSVSTIYIWKKQLKDKTIAKDVNIVTVQKEISALMVENRLEEALEICKSYEYNLNVQSQQIIILTRLDRYEEAIRICNSYENNPNIQSQYISILIKLGRYKDALKICSLPQLQNNKNIMQQKSKILSKLMKKTQTTNNIVIEKTEVSKSNIVDEIFTKIYIGNISLDEIKNSDINEFEKLILVILYYEKNRLPGVLKIIKEAKNKYKDDIQKLKKLKKLYARFETKKNIVLDYFTYSTILNCSLRDNLVVDYRNEQLKKEKINAIDKNVETNKQSQNTSKNDNIKKEHKTIVSNASEQTIKKPHIVVERQCEKKKKISKVDISNIKIEDIFPKEILSIKKYLYVEMNKIQTKSVIEIWDKFCILIEKSITDEKALSKFIEIAICINKISSYVSIDIDSLYVKKHKYIKPSN